jgi:hypothetical protein
VQVVNELGSEPSAANRCAVSSDRVHTRLEYLIVIPQLLECDQIQWLIEWEPL